MEIVWPPSATEVQTSSEAKVDRPPRDLSAWASEQEKIRTIEKVQPPNSRKQKGFCYTGIKNSVKTAIFDVVLWFLA